MDKIVEGKVIKKAKFIRTTCKVCRGDIRYELVIKGFGWCGKKCRRKWIVKHNRSVG